MGTTTTLELSVSLVYIFSSRSAVDAGSSALCRCGAREHAPRILYIVARVKRIFWFRLMDPSSLFPTASTKVFQRIDVKWSELFEQVIFVQSRSSCRLTITRILCVWFPGGQMSPTNLNKKKFSNKLNHFSLSTIF